MRRSQRSTVRVWRSCWSSRTRTTRSTSPGGATCWRRVRWRWASVLQRRTAAPLVWAGGLTLEAVMVSAVNDALSHPLGQAPQAAVRGARDGFGRHGARAAAAADRWLLARANLTRPDTDA